MQNKQQALAFARTISQLQSCADENEVFALCGSCIANIGSWESGAVYLFCRSNSFLELRHEFGHDDFDPIVPSDDCLAARDGRQHADDSGELSCRHIPKSSGHHLCMPLVARGQFMGVWHLSGSNPLPQAAIQFTPILADSMAATLARLRKDRRLQFTATRDFLTGVPNRRHLEEYLSDQLLRAERRQFAIGIVFIDIDLFKPFNDLHSYFVGDKL